MPLVFIGLLLQSFVPWDDGLSRADFGWVQKDRSGFGCNPGHPNNARGPEWPVL
jgi:hypothetical protein